MRFLITGTDTRVGKTMLGCALAFAFKVRGMRVGVMKPVESGCAEANGILTPSDGPALIASASSDLPIELVTPYCYRSVLPPAPAAQADGVALPSFDTICDRYRQIAARSDAILVEDCGGLAAPIDWQHTYADLATDLRFEVILVVANRGAFINAAKLTSEYATLRGITIRGFVMSALDRDASATIARDADFIARATGLSCLGTVRFKEPVSRKIVERLL